MRHNPVTMVLWYYYLFHVSFTVCICFKFYLELSIEYKILNDHEIHNWIGRIKEQIACSSTIELEGLIQTKFHLDKGQKYLLREYDKEGSLFFDADDINKVEEGARLKIHVYRRRWVLIMIFTLNHLHQMKQDLIVMMKWMLRNLFSFLCGEIRLTGYFYRFYRCRQK